MNVLSGERYKIVPSEIKDYVRGMYGRPPVSISKSIKQQIVGDEEVITCRPADLIEPQLPRLREEIACYARSEEDVLSYALFPEQARDFLGRREDPFYDVPRARGQRHHRCALSGALATTRERPHRTTAGPQGAGRLR